MIAHPYLVSSEYLLNLAKPALRGDGGDKIRTGPHRVLPATLECLRVCYYSFQMGSNEYSTAVRPVEQGEAQ